jgi:hypothetical protein
VFDKEIERSDHLNIGEEIDVNRKLFGLSRKHETRERVMLPVREMLRGFSR